MNRLSLFLTGILLSSLPLRGQQLACSQVDSLLATKSPTQGTLFIFQTLSRLPRQPSCFYEKAIRLYQNRSDGGAIDSVERLCTLWETISPTPCPAKEAYLQFLADHFQSQTKDRFCRTAHELSEKCKEKKWSSRSLQLILLCPEFSCAELDTLLGNDSLNLQESKKNMSLLAQRGCTHTKSYTRLSLAVLEKEPNFNGLFYQAELFREQGNTKDAYHYYAKAEKMSASKEEQAFCYLGIAKTLELQKNWAGAKDFATMSSEADPKNPESFVFLAHLLQVGEKICAFHSQEEKCALYLLIAEAFEQAKRTTDAQAYRQKSNQENPLKGPDTSAKVLLGCFINKEVSIKKNENTVLRK